MPISDNHSSSNSREKYGLKSTLAQTLAVVVQNCISIEWGMAMVTPSIVLTDLFQNSSSSFSISLIEASWYVSLLHFTHLFGALLSGTLQKQLGRKRCMIIANLPSFIGWILLYLSHSSTVLCLSNSMVGFGIGFSSIAKYSYTGEITEPRLRGRLASLTGVSIMIGVSLIFVLESLFHWRSIALASVCFLIIRTCLISLIPESPIWLIAHGKNDKAEKALCWLRGWMEPETVKYEFLELIRHNKPTNDQESTVDTEIKGGGLFAEIAQFKNPSAYRPLILVIIYLIVSLISCFTPFTMQIIVNVGFAIYPNTYMIVFTVLQGLGSMVLMLTINCLGKRYLTLLTISVNTTLIFMLGVYIKTLKHNYVTSSPWIPFTIISSIYFSGSCGIYYIPWILLSEVFPYRIRGIATGLCTGISGVILLVLIKSYISIESALTLEYTMFLFSFISFIGFIYFYYYLPETENKTLLEIEKH
ncbi:facilitated trehalose transporter Tret1-like, partial [Sipha flava]|uniref:Facilitated trehalose transporter Tret1-like n=1 Tax=Sipha flava TaxID=143950 RepID=A0A8B8G1V4_9HEMI